MTLYEFKTTHESVYPIILVSSSSTPEFQFSFSYYCVNFIYLIEHSYVKHTRKNVCLKIMLETIKKAFQESIIMR